MYLIFRWIMNALALLVAAAIVPGFGVASFYAALVGALVLGIVNTLIRPLLFVLTLPVNILTFGLFSFVLNALMLLLVGTIVKGVEVGGFVTAILAALVIWIVNALTYWLIEKAKHS